MNKELQEKLYKKYPKIFVEKDLSPQETCMCWGICCGDGWFSLLNALCHQIQNHIDNPPSVKTNFFWAKSISNDFHRFIWNKIIFNILNEKERNEFYKNFSELYFNLYEEPKEKIPQVVAHQVKSKFAGLRFYYSGGDRTISDYISFAENLSYYICEECGMMNDTVNQTKGGWIETLCEKCRDNKSPK